MAGTYYFVNRRASVERELGYTEGYSADLQPIPLDQIERDLLWDLGIENEIQEKSFHPLFDTLTDLGWYSLYNRGGSYVEHFHWATYISPRLDRIIEDARDRDNSRETAIFMAFKIKAEELLLRKYRFYGTG